MTKLPIPRTTPLFSSVAREMDEMQNRLRRFFNEGVPSEMTFTESLGWTPVVEIIENPEELVLTAELPGLNQENVEVLFEDNTLMIRGEKKEERKEGNGEKRYHLWERSYGMFQRSFSLPPTVDPAKITADFNDGVLTVHLPKTAQAKTKGRRIEIAAKK